MASDDNAMDFENNGNVRDEHDAMWKLANCSPGRFLLHRLGLGFCVWQTHPCNKTTTIQQRLPLIKRLWWFFSIIRSRAPAEVIEIWEAFSKLRKHRRHTPCQDALGSFIKRRFITKTTRLRYEENEKRMRRGNRLSRRQMKNSRIEAWWSGMEAVN